MTCIKLNMIKPKSTILLLGWLFISTLFYSCGNEKKEKETISNTENTEKSELEIGKDLFNNKGKCLSCHQPYQKIIGPSIESIVQIYMDKNGNMVEFLKGNSEPIVDPTQYEIMKANLQITKQMSNEELQAIVTYMNSFLK